MSFNVAVRKLTRYGTSAGKVSVEGVPWFMQEVIQTGNKMDNSVPNLCDSVNKLTATNGLGI